MKARLDYDTVIKDLFVTDRPSLMTRITGGRPAVAFLNLELAIVEKRAVDLLIQHDDGWLSHIDFQSANDPDMVFRMGVCGVLVAQKYRRRVRQTVLYVGRDPLRMKDHVDVGDFPVRYRLMDIRDLNAGTLLKSGCPGDWALAMLARNGIRRLRDIIRKVRELEGAARQRVLTQMLILSGLRGASEELTMEYRGMGLQIEISENAFLREIHDNALAQGKAEMLRDLLRTKFGRLPKWAETRLKGCSSAQAEQWATKILTASKLEDVLGKR